MTAATTTATRTHELWVNERGFHIKSTIGKLLNTNALQQCRVSILLYWKCYWISGTCTRRAGNLRIWCKPTCDAGDGSKQDEFSADDEVDSDFQCAGDSCKYEDVSSDYGDDEDLTRLPYRAVMVVIRKQCKLDDSNYTTRTMNLGSLCFVILLPQFVAGTYDLQTDGNELVNRAKFPICHC